MKTLTKQQIERQDFVDNQVFELLQHALPQSAKIEWDIEMIAGIREAMRGQVVSKKIMTEQKFYPYIKI